MQDYNKVERRSRPRRNIQPYSGDDVQSNVMKIIQARYPQGYVPYSSDGNGNHRKVDPNRWYDQDEYYTDEGAARIVKSINNLGLSTMEARIKPE